MALHNARLDHAYGGGTSDKRVIEDLAFNVELLARLLEEEHYVRDFGPADLQPNLGALGGVVAASANTNVTSTSATAITGATVTFTPPVECLCEVYPVWDIENTGAAAPLFIGEVFVDGAASSASAQGQPAVGTRTAIPGLGRRIALTAAASHTIDLRGKLVAATTTIQVKTAHTGFVYRLVPLTTVSEVTQRQQVLILPDVQNGEIGVTFPRPLGWYSGRVRVEVLYGGSVSSSNAWRVDLLGNALALADAYTALSDVSGSVDVPGIGTLNTAGWYLFSTLLLPVDRSHQMISFRLRRAGGHANDTYAGDVYIHALRCRYLPGKHEV